ncbi:hypothetical protein DNU06_09700 [Putridiphycobacter roseus]|uniref:Outer membrane protein beta-barrel domain-containing protein n=1 Tax=Putridiphycobacter roseus TaxID=2219161 RepID=A0A2W1ND36_9FLAO|nr:outer membrane beta-barrel protein [Putridiphycobacter roseus]PZE17013.1 hypothetical protein DNU06_09700 [Putridiphycobacter roseus]
MYKALLLTVFCLLVTLSSSAQTWKYMRQEFQVGIGASSFFGELGGAKGDAKHDIRDIRFSATRPVLNLGYKYMLHPIVSVKGLFTMAILSGDDASTDNLIRSNRNLSFKSGLFEMDGIVEIYPFGERISRRYRIKGVGGRSAFSISPYFSFGVGIAAFQPKAELDGVWYKLQPLGTEGQGLAGRPDKYKRYTYALPLAVGAKYFIDRNWSVGFELSVRYTGSDYIDDVSTSYYLADEIEAAYGPVAAALSDRGIDKTLGETGVIQYSNGGNNYLQRGDPKWNDAYSLAIISIHYRLRKGTRFIPKF